MKYKVVNHLDGFPVKAGDGGLYAILPYEKLDANKKALFKVGLADSFEKRFESYHTYYPLGFYYKNLLLNPNKNLNEVRNKAMADFKKKHDGRPTPADRATITKTVNSKNLISAEKAVFAEIQELGGRRLRSTTRIKDANELGGVSEWFYTDGATLDKAFEKTNKTYGGKFYSTHLNRINAIAAQNRRNSTYTGEIYYNVA